MAAICLGVSVLTFVAILWAASAFVGETRQFDAISSYSSLATAVFTAGGAMAAALYVVLTFQLWQEAARQIETQRRIAEATLMQSLMVEYDGMRDDVQRVRDFYAAFSSKQEAVAVFAENRQAQRLDWIGLRVDPSRFRISRFFVKVRKLSKAGYLDERVVVAALGQSHIQYMFLDLIDPLDQECYVLLRGHKTSADRLFYEGLAKQYPQLWASTF